MHLLHPGDSESTTWQRGHVWHLSGCVLATQSAFCLILLRRWYATNITFRYERYINKKHVSMSKLLEFNYRCCFCSTFIVFAIDGLVCYTEANTQEPKFKSTLASHLFLETKIPTCSSLTRKPVFFMESLLVPNRLTRLLGNFRILRGKEQVKYATSWANICCDLSLMGQAI